MEEKITAWIARDKNDSLFLYIGGKPIKYQTAWKQFPTPNEDCETYPCSADFEFPQVKWEDEEPTKVKITIELDLNE